MKKYPLLIYEDLSRRMRGRLLLLGLALLILGLIDIFWRPILGDFWFLIWIALAVVAALWVYYALVMRRAGLFLYPSHFILRGPSKSVKVSYGRIHSITTTQPAQHFQLSELNRQERALVKPYYKQTCVFVGLNSFPKALKHRNRWFPRSLFGFRERGILLIVSDWLTLSRNLEDARQRWREAKGLQDREDKRSLAARILDY